MIDRRSLLIALGASAATVALAQPEPQRVPIELVEEALELEAAIRVGDAKGDVTLIEFFDYTALGANAPPPTCRRCCRRSPTSPMCS